MNKKLFYDNREVIQVSALVNSHHKRESNKGVDLCGH